MTDAEIMKRARRKVYARTAFRVHLLICVSLSVMLIIIYSVTMFGGYFWPAWPMLGFGITLVAHAGASSAIFNSDEKIKAEYDRMKQTYESGRV